MRTECTCGEEDYDYCRCWDESWDDDEDDEPVDPWLAWAERANRAFTSADNALKAAYITAQLPWPKPPHLRGPTWWVPMLPLPAGLNVRIESEWQAANYTFESIQTAIKAFERPETVYLELGERRWIVTSARWQYSTDPTNTRTLTSVLASKPPDFGWWMPSLKAA